MKEEKDYKAYYIGIDMGTNSVGWAATDTEYNLMRAKGKDLWGVRLFNEASSAADRRSKRVARRRLEREKARKAMLRTFFADAINDIDPGFFQRLDESFLYYEDRSDFNKQYNALFNDEDYKDADYFREFPTIFHLRQALLHENRAFDVRLVYLAVLNMFSHRGHFLNTNMSSDEDGSNNFNQAWGELADSISTALSGSAPDTDNICDLSYLASSENFDSIKKIIGDTNRTRTARYDALRELFGIGKNDNKLISSILKLICGLNIKVKDLTSDIKDLSIDEDALKESIGFTDSNLDEELDKFHEILGDEWFDILLKAKTVYEICLLSSILGDNTYLSDSRVDMYNRHREDLYELKEVLTRYNPEAYEKIFRTMDVGSYSAYVGSVNSHGKKIRRLGTTKAKSGTVKEELYKAIKKILKSVPDEATQKVIILNKIEKDCFLEKQLTGNNGVIPNQVHSRELKKILSNAAKYLEFLSDTDQSGLSVKDKIVQLFEFQIPYYIGPLGRELNGVKGYNNWAVRTDEGKKQGVTITPWNFDEMIDRKASAEEFIKRMLNKCTYLDGEYTLPKHSLAYQKFMVLNEINNIKIGNARIGVKAKQGIYTDLFSKGNKVSKKKIKEYLVNNNFANKDDEITGLADEMCTTKLSSLGKFASIFGISVNKQSNIDMIENIIYWSTIYSGDRKIIKEKIKSTYPNVFDKKTLNKILGFKFDGWGTLSRGFLELQGVSKATGVINSIVGFMWEGQSNLMELLSEEYTFAEELKNQSAQAIKPLSNWEIEDLEDMYLSPAVKRMVWQTMKIVDEVQSVIGHAPKRVFVEVTRGDNKKVRTKSRKQSLIELYKNIKSESRDWMSELESRDESEFKSRKLYLYYMQQCRCMYSGEAIALRDLMDDNLYDIDHIYPQHFTKDDSIHNNLVLVKKEYNARKSDMPITAEIQSKMHSSWKALKDGGFITGEKYSRLMRKNYAFTDEEKIGFINRQLVETSQATKAITRIFGQAFKNTKVVFSKARLVSDFRQKFDLPKSRVLNCYHHANDAYLNIVVGNSYYVKFEGNPARFIKESESKEDDLRYKYHMSRFFEYQISNRNEVAWRIDGANRTIDRVKRIMGKYSPLVSYKTEEGRGEYFKETIYSKFKAKPMTYTGVKTKNSPLCDVTKYGGKTSVRTSGYCFVKYTNKKKEVRKFETLPIYLGNSSSLTDKVIEDYLRESYLMKGMTDAANTVKVLIKFVPQKTVLLLDGHKYVIGGSTGDEMYINSIVPLKMPIDDVHYLHKLEKAKELNDYKEVKSVENKKGEKLLREVITKEKNNEFFDVIVEKLRTDAYSSRRNSVLNKLENGKEKFIDLDVEAQVNILLDVINNIYGIKQTVNLERIGASKYSGMCFCNRNIAENKEVQLIFNSITGLYERKIDLLTI